MMEIKVFKGTTVIKLTTTDGCFVYSRFINGSETKYWKNKLFNCLETFCHQSCTKLCQIELR